MELRIWLSDYPSQQDDNRRDKLRFEGQSSSAYAMPLDHDNALLDILGGEGGQYLGRPLNDLGFAPVAVAEKNHAWLCRAGHRQELWIVQVCCDDRPSFLFGAGNDFRIGRAMKPELGGMNGIMSLLSEPCRKNRRQRHVDQEFHSAGAAGASATVSSSARKGAYRSASSISLGSR